MNKTGKQICCALRDFQTCTFPLVLAHCGIDALDNVEREMRPMNAICGVITLQFTKCEMAAEKAAGAEGEQTQ